MIISTKTGATIALGLVIAAIAAGSGMANPAAGTMQCGIAKSSQNGMLALEGTVLSPTAVSGEYRFSIQSASNGGSSNISQGGYFEAAAGQPTPMGKVMLNAGASYTIAFDVTANGKKLDCDQDLATLF